MEALGIDLKLLIAQIINFALLFFLLSRFLYKPVSKMLDDRSAKIAHGIKSSEESVEKLEKAEAEAEKIREKAYKEADVVMEQAKKESAAASNEILKKAEKQAEAILAAANEEANSAKDKAMSSAKGELSNIIVMALNKIVGNEIDEKDKERLTAKAIKEL